MFVFDRKYHHEPPGTHLRSSCLYFPYLTKYVANLFRHKLLTCLIKAEKPCPCCGMYPEDIIAIPRTRTTPRVRDSDYALRVCMG